MIATTSKQLRKGLIAAITMVLGFTCLVGCGLHSDPLANNSNSGDNPGDVIVVGSQDYYSNEIIAEIYAQSLENNGNVNFALGSGKPICQKWKMVE